MAAPPHRRRNLFVVALAGCAVAAASVALVLALRRAPTVDAPRVADVGAWSRGADAPLALTEVAAAPFQGRIWVVGGLDAAGDAVAAVQIYDPATDSWAVGPDLPERLHHAALVVDDAGLLVVGGYVGPSFSRATDGTWRYDAEAEAWTPGGILPEPRAAGAAASDGGTRIVYAGGVGPSGLAGDVFLGESGRWRRAGALGTAREHLAATVDGEGRTFVLGGRNGIVGNLGTVDVVEGDAVRSLGDLVTPRGGVAAFWHRSVGACLAGGEEPAGTRSEVECIAADGTVVALPPLGVARHGLGAAVLGDVAYVLLGGPEPGLHVSGVVEMLRLPAP